MQQHSGNKQKEEKGGKNAAAVGPMSKMDVAIKPLKTKRTTSNSRNLPARITA